MEDSIDGVQGLEATRGWDNLQSASMYRGRA